MWSVSELTTSGNKRSHMKACQVMKSIVPGCWQESDPLEGGEPSSLSQTVHYTEKRGRKRASLMGRWREIVTVIGQETKLVEQCELLTSHTENWCSPRWKLKSAAEHIEVAALTEVKEFGAILLHNTHYLGLSLQSHIILCISLVGFSITFTLNPNRDFPILTTFSLSLSLFSNT